jgi:hypothetical protein
MERVQKRDARKIIVGLALLALSVLGTSGIAWISEAADETSPRSGAAVPEGEAALKSGLWKGCKSCAVDDGIGGSNRGTRSAKD